MSIDVKSKVVAHIRAGSSGSEVCDTLLGDGVTPFECELWDYKENHGDSALSLGELCRDVSAFFNNHGGYLIVGVSDDFQLVGTDAKLNQQTIRQKVRHYFGADVAVTVDEVLVGAKAVLVIGIPKRQTTVSTAVASKPGPEGSNGRPIFGAGAVYFRIGEACQLIRDSTDLQYLASDRNHALDLVLDHGSGIKQNNLPDRNAICAKFIGRSEVKKELWLWLADKLSRYRVIAGPGGFGKTSAAYSFAEDVCEASSNGFMQAVWLSAKSKQFSGTSNTFESMPYSGGLTDSFRSIETLLSAIAESLPIEESEWVEAAEPERVELLREALLVIPSFVVIDDLDSLPPDDQRRTIELVIQISGGRSKFLVTTRNNFMAPVASTTTLPGLSGEDFSRYVDALGVRFGRSISAKDTQLLEKETEGSPLFAESVFRLIKLGSKFSDALNLWKGKEGEAVRAASFKRELQQLTLKARRVLFAMSRTDSASLVELCKFSELERVEVEQAIQELDQLFLFNSEQIAGEPRFRVPDNLRRVLEEVKAESIPDYKEVERRVAALRREAAGGGTSRGQNAPVAAAINQAMAQLGSGDPKAACLTVEEALVNYPKSADLWMVKARCFAERLPIQVDTVRAAFEKSFLLGKRESRLFEKWIDFETLHGNANAAVDVAEKGIENIGGTTVEWLMRAAAAYYRRGEQRLTRTEFDDAAADFRVSIKHLKAAIRAGSLGARASVLSALERSTEGVWRSLPIAAGASGNTQVLRLAKEALIAGDKRRIWIERSIVALHSLFRNGRAGMSDRDYEVADTLVADLAGLADAEMEFKLVTTFRNLDK
jgi:hypothetical protein